MISSFQRGLLSSSVIYIWWQHKQNSENKAKTDIPLIRYEKEELRWRCIAKQLAHVQLAAVQQCWAGYKKVPNQWEMALRCTHSLGFLLICHLQPHYDSVQRCCLSLNYSCHKGPIRQTYRGKNYNLSFNS